MSKNFGFYLLNFWTLFSFVVVIYDHLINNQFSDVLTPVLVIYVAILSIYVGAKEFGRWRSRHSSMHLGELYVIAWTVIIVCILISSVLLEKPYKLSHEIISTYISVLGILVITQRSKSLHRRRSKRRIVA